MVERLITLSSDYWENFLNIEDDAVHQREPMTPQTPECRPGVYPTTPDNLLYAPYTVETQYMYQCEVVSKFWHVLVTQRFGQYLV